MKQDVPKTTVVIQIPNDRLESVRLFLDTYGTDPTTPIQLVDIMRDIRRQL